MFGCPAKYVVGLVMLAGVALSACSGPPNVVELPPQDTSKLAALHDWSIGRAAHKLGFWGGVSALVLGWGLSGLFLGGGDDGG